jgi:hypothetical protein
MTSEQLTAILPGRVVDWGFGPEPFSNASSECIPRCRFSPTENLTASFAFWNRAAWGDHRICGDDQANIKVQVRIARRESGQSITTRGACKPNSLGSWRTEVDQ